MTAKKLGILTFCCAMLFLGALGVQFAGPQFVHQLTRDGFGPLRGHSYAYVIPKPWGWPVLATVGDDRGELYSKLVLTENGVPLKHPHAPVPAIDAVGAGRYVHMRANELYFSSSDNSDPRSSGRSYELSVPLTPAPGLTRVLLTVTILSLAVWALVRSGGQWRWPGRTAAALASFAAYALVWQMLILSGRPRIVNSGDGGVVAGIAAANLWPDRMAGDIVYGNAANFSFYKTLTIPLTIALTSLTDDIGTSYALLAGPLLLIQMIGFYLVGRRLCAGYGWPAVLALLSVAPVYVMSGELWGSLSEPLTRYTFNALFPFVMLASLPPFAPWKPFAAMAMCALGIYLHPVSAPSVALALWIAFALQRPAHTSWIRHLSMMAAAGFVFLLAAVPFALSFMMNFPTQSGSGAAGLVNGLMRESVGNQYTDLTAALVSFLRYAVVTQQRGFGWFWLVAIAAAFTLWKLRPSMPERLAGRVGFIGLVGFGLIVSSVGLTGIDQALAFLRGGYPVQLDLIRNIRFFVPIALVLAICGAAWLCEDQTLRPQVRSIALAGGGTAALLWTLSYPTVPLQSLLNALDGRIERQSDGSATRALGLLAAAPAGGSVLTLPATRPTDSSEQLGLAVRYAGRQPTVFLKKDINLLSYSSSDGVLDWDTRRKLLTALEAETVPARIDSILEEMISRYAIAYVLMHDDVPAVLSAAVLRRGKMLGPEGEWKLLTTGRR